MRLRLTCKDCGMVIAVDSRHAGKTGRCPNSACGARIRVPVPASVSDRQGSEIQRILPPRRGHSTRPAVTTTRRARLPYLVAAGIFTATVCVVLLLDVMTPTVAPIAVAVPTGGGQLVAAEPSEVEPPPEDPAFKEVIQPFLATYCSDCHGSDFAEADLNLSTYDSVESLHQNRQKWNQILGIIRIGAMPPPDYDPQPPMEVRKIVTDWLDHTLNYVDCSLVDDPGHVTVRRLNRVEYNNTIRDLVGIDFKPAADFPSDDVGNGFDNQGEVLSLPPLLLEKYLDAAEEIARRAIITDFDALLTRRKDGGTLASVGDVTRPFDFQPGTYLLRAEVRADQAGPDLARAEFQFEGKPLETYEVQGHGQPNVFQIEIEVENAGEKQFGVKFLNDYYNAKAEDPRQRDRNLHVNWLEVVGPRNQPPDLPETHRRIVVATPGDDKSVRAAAEEVFQSFATRAFRRPAEPAEVARLADLVEMAVEHGETYEQAVALGVQAVLVSPHFLFRIEDDRSDAPEAVIALSDYELASRLSYFLWSSMPDDELTSLAAQGVLSKPENLHAQIERMLADGKSEALVVNFFGQWLNLRNLEEINPDPRKYPWWNTQLKTSMRTETELFCGAIVGENRSIMDLLNADFTYANPRLAELYGVKWKDEDPRELYYSYSGPGKNDGDYKGNRRSGHYSHEQEFVRVELPENRRGVLTHASILALTSNPGETSPVKRGKWILENILGTPPPPAPPGVPSFDEAKKANPDATLREQLAMHRSDPGCASCHTMMDPLGLGFEHYDVIGKWRDKDGKIEVDASGRLDDGKEFTGAMELIAALEERDEQFARFFIEKLLTYAIGRGLEPYDRCTIDTVFERVKSDGYRFSSIVTAIVESDPFRKRRGNGARP